MPTEKGPLSDGNHENGLIGGKRKNMVRIA